MSTIDLGHGCRLNMPDERPTDPIHAQAWDMLRLERQVLLAAIDACEHAGAVRIVGQYHFIDEAVATACRRRLNQLAGGAPREPQALLFSTVIPSGG